MILIYEPCDAGYVLDLRNHLLKLFLLNVKPVLSKSIYADTLRVSSGALIEVTLCSATVPQTEKPLDCWHYLATCLSGSLIDYKTDALVHNNNTK